MKRKSRSRSRKSVADGHVGFAEPQDGKRKPASYEREMGRGTVRSGPGRPSLEVWCVSSTGRSDVRQQGVPMAEERRRLRWWRMHRRRQEEQGGGQHASECRAVMRCSQGLVGCAFPLGCGGGEDCEYYRPTPSTKGGREGGGGRRRASSLMRSYAFPARSDHGELRRDRTRIYYGATRGRRSLAG